MVFTTEFLGFLHWWSSCKEAEFLLSKYPLFYIFFSYHIWHGFFWYIYKYNYLNGIVANVSRKTEVDQYCNTATVISWFKNLRGKHMRKFIKFDVAEFYPSISENLQIDPSNRLKLLQKLMTMLSTRSILQENHYFLTKMGLGSRKETIHYLT